MGKFIIGTSQTLANVDQLDICDSNQCFGVEVLSLSVDSSPIKKGILHLATISWNATLPWEQSNVLNAGNWTGDGDGEGVITHALLETFGLLETVYTDLTAYWSQEEESGQGVKILERLLPQLPGSSTLAYSTYWLLVRLGECHNTIVNRI